MKLHSGDTTDDLENKANNHADREAPSTVAHSEPKPRDDQNAEVDCKEEVAAAGR